MIPTPGSSRAQSDSGAEEDGSPMGDISLEDCFKLLMIEFMESIQHTIVATPIGDLFIAAAAALKKIRVTRHCDPGSPGQR